jgi:hypothetical protein
MKCAAKKQGYIFLKKTGGSWKPISKPLENSTS